MKAQKNGLRPAAPRPPQAITAFLIAIGAMALLVSTASALELVGGDINTSAPGSTFNSQTFAQPLPWNNVGQVGGGSAIYLGDIGNNGEYWVLTPDHVAPSLPSTANFNGLTYNTVAGSWVQLTNSDSSAADMVLFQLNVNANPAGLITMPLQTTTPAAGTDLYYVGFGTGTMPDTNSTQRWGYNQVGSDGLMEVGDANGNVTAFLSQYNSSSPNPNEAQAILGDSGGAAFTYNAGAGTWQLGGMLFATNGSDPPTATFSADIATYDEAIMTAVPEPGAGAAFLTGAIVLLAARAARKRLRAGSA